MNSEENFFKRMDSLFNKGLLKKFLEKLIIDNEFPDKTLFIKDAGANFLDKLTEYEEFKDCTEMVVEHLPNTISGSVSTYKEPFKFSGKIGIYSFSFQEVPLERYLLIRAKQY